MIALALALYRLQEGDLAAKAAPEPEPVTAPPIRPRVLVRTPHPA
jgi:hypothetical protein